MAKQVTSVKPVKIKEDKNDGTEGASKVHRKIMLKIGL